MTLVPVFHNGSSQAPLIHRHRFLVRAGARGGSLRTLLSPPKHAATADWTRADLAGDLCRSTDLHAWSDTLVDENLNVYVTIELAALSVLIACNGMGRAISDWH